MSYVSLGTDIVVLEVDVGPCESGLTGLTACDIVSTPFDPATGTIVSPVKETTPLSKVPRDFPPVSDKVTILLL